MDEFLDSGHYELRDLQTKMLLGDEQYDFLARIQSEPEFRSALGSVFSRLDLVGVQERFEDTLIAATLMFGWPATNPRKWLNVRSIENPVEFSDAHHRRIVEMNRWTPSPTGWRASISPLLTGRLRQERPCSLRFWLETRSGGSQGAFHESLWVGAPVLTSFTEGG